MGGIIGRDSAIESIKTPHALMAIKYPTTSAGINFRDFLTPVSMPDEAKRVFVGPGGKRMVMTKLTKSHENIHYPFPYKVGQILQYLVLFVDLLNVRKNLIRKRIPYKTIS